MGLRIERWVVNPLSCPRPVRHCSSCGRDREFRCTHKFRVNAHKKTIDVWLLYRCETCDETWKLPILARCSVAAIDAALFDKFLCNDVATARQYAFDLPRLRSHASVVSGDEYRIERTVVQEGTAELHIDIRLPLPFAIRLDRLLASTLGVTRAAIVRCHESGQLRVRDATNAIGRPARSGQHVVLTMPATLSLNCASIEGCDSFASLCGESE